MKPTRVLSAAERAKALENIQQEVERKIAAMERAAQQTDGAFVQARLGWVMALKVVDDALLARVNRESGGFGLGVQEKSRAAGIVRALFYGEKPPTGGVAYWDAMVADIEPVVKVAAEIVRDGLAGGLSDQEVVDAVRAVAGTL